MNILTEAKQVGSAFLVTGAFNPYTRGHEEVARTAAEHAHSSGYSHFYHGLGASENKPDAPLSFSQKEGIVKESHKHIRGGLGKTNLKFGIIPQKSSITPFHQLVHLVERGKHKHITVALGPDQFIGDKSVKKSIEEHIKKHGGLLGSDRKTVHKVKIDFHRLAEKRDESERSPSQLRALIQNGRMPVEHAKAGRLRAAVQTGDDELAHSLMPDSIHAAGKQKEYARMIRSQFKSIAAQTKPKKKKKITEMFSIEKINEYISMLNEAQIVRSVINQRKYALAERLKRAKAPKDSVEEQNAKIQNARMRTRIEFGRKLLAAKRAEIAAGLDKPPRRTGTPSKTVNEETLLEATRRKSVSSPAKTRTKVRTEVRAAGSSKKKDTIRKQEERKQKKKGNYAVILGKDKKIKIVERKAIGKSKVILSPEKFDKGKAKKYLDDPTFEITDSSKKLFPEFSRAKPKGAVKKKKAKETKKKKKKVSRVTKENPRDIVNKLPDTPPGGRERTTPKSQYPDFNHTSLDLEAAIPVLLNQMMGVEVDSVLMKKIGDKIKTSQTLGASARRAAQSIVEQFGEVVSVHMGAAKTTITPLWKKAGGADTTPKTDILLVPKKVWKDAKGDISKIDMKKAIRCSMKVGDARIINAESGEAAATVEAALEMAGDIASKNRKVKEIIKEIKDAMLKFAKSAELGQFTVDDVRDLVAAGEEPTDPNFKKYVKLINEQDKLKDLVANKFREVFDVSEEFRRAILRESFTGVAKFGPNSAACATHVLAMTKDGSNVGMEEISDEFLDKIIPDLKIRGAFKGRSWEVGPKGKKTKFRGFSTLFNIDYKRKIHEETEDQIQQDVQTIEPTSSMTYPNAASIVKNDLDQIGDNFDLLMKYSEMEPSMLTSNALDLTEYVTIPAREYNTIVIDGNRVVTVPVYDFERFEQNPQEVEMMNEQSYEFINDFLIENKNNEEALNIALTSGLVSPETIMMCDLESDLASLLNEMWENSLLSPEMFASFVNEARNYRKEYDNYHSKPKQRKNRSSRVLARRKKIKKGHVRKGDGNDVHHEDGNPQNNSDSNLKVLSKSKNRSMNEEHGAGETGTDELRKKYVEETPYMIDPVKKILKGVVKNGIKRN